jgi:hypothetical protein
MSLLKRFFNRPRLLGEVNFALGAAVIMALAGTVVSLATPPLRAFPTASPPVRWFIRGATGFGLGWWAGLVWSIGLAFYARRYQPPPPLPALTRATWVAAALIAAATLIALYLGLSFSGSAGVGVIVATLAARTTVSHAARGASP